MNENNIKTLNVRLYGELVGVYKNNNTFTYTKDHLKTKTYALSQSLPLSRRIHKGNIVENFFSSLLPEEQARENIARKLGVSQNNSFSLLAEIGLECAGAIEIFPEDYKMEGINKEKTKLSDEDLEKLILSLKNQSIVEWENEHLSSYRMSLAGAQNKCALIMEDDNFHLGNSYHPSTHILKTMKDNVKDIHLNEYFCMKLAKALGIVTADVFLKYTKKAQEPFLIIQRYDRDQKDTSISLTTTRLHQEDFCQIFGIHNKNKYQNEGGASLKQITDFLKDNSKVPISDIQSMAKITIYNFLIANADAHAKNFSILYDYKNTSFALSPAYDLLCTYVYPYDKKLAMKIGGKRRPHDIFKHNFAKEFGEKITNKTIKYFAENILTQAEHIKQEIEQETPLNQSTIYDEIINIIKERLGKLYHL